MKKNSTVIIYQAKNGAIELKTDVHEKTLWATQAQIANIFDIERSVATKHIGNILKDNEVDAKRNVQKMHIANSDKSVAFYSLDIILAVGYRANSESCSAYTGSFNCIDATCCRKQPKRER